MSFTTTWNNNFEEIPKDNEVQANGAGEIRDFKVAIAQRLDVDHYLDRTGGNDADGGQHSKITFQAAQSGDPTVVGTKGFLYTKSINGNIELFWMDSGGHVLQLTSLGLVAGFPSGTKLWFYQGAAPTGWTIVTGVGDRVIAVSDNSSANYASMAGGTIGGTWTQNPHYHRVSGQTSGSSATATMQIGGGANAANQFHYHTCDFDSGNDTGAYTLSGSTVADNAWRPAAAIGIIASKN